MVYYSRMLRSAIQFVENPRAITPHYPPFLSGILRTVESLLCSKTIGKVQAIFDQNEDPMVRLLLFGVRSQLAASGEEIAASSLPTHEHTSWISSFEEAEDLGTALQFVECALRETDELRSLPSADRELYIKIFVRLRQALHFKDEEREESFWDWRATLLPYNEAVTFIPFDLIRDTQDFDAFTDAGGLRLPDLLGRNILHDLAHRIADERSEALLYYALASGQLNVDKLDSWHAAPLHVACCFGNTTAVKALLDYNADPNLRHKVGQTPLHYAARLGNESICQLLLSAPGVDPNLRNAIFKQTPLHIAVSEGHEPIVKLLLNHQNPPVNLNATDWRGYTAQDIAKAQGRISIEVLFIVPSFVYLENNE